ncbi:MAG TPA: tripartite tricarboxylate transporter substrate-binding protein, partial [Burkholderiales bacterium]|nr:tripartite tricarboxylate transporter substrate-binding protein [Burkholderiales bacterium]
MRTRKIAAGILFGLCAASASAQMGYPSRPIRMVVDTSPGGLTDILGRVAAEGLAQQLGRQVVVENKAGASGNLAIEYMVKS